MWFFGCLSLDTISEPYHPNRVVRQFGRVQDKPCAPICPQFSSRKKTKSYIARYDTRDSAFLNFKEYLLDEEMRGPKATVKGQCTPEYDAWYTSVAWLHLNEGIPHSLFEKQKIGEVCMAWFLLILLYGILMATCLWYRLIMLKRQSRLRRAILLKA